MPWWRRCRSCWFRRLRERRRPRGPTAAPPPCPPAAGPGRARAGWRRVPPPPLAARACATRCAGTERAIKRHKILDKLRSARIVCKANIFWNRKLPASPRVARQRISRAMSCGALEGQKGMERSAMRYHAPPPPTAAKQASTARESCPTFLGLCQQ